MRYYDLKAILSKEAQYNIVFGERSNGKTYAVLKYGLMQYVKNGSQLAIIRRWRDDFVGKRGVTMFDAIVSNFFCFYGIIKLNKPLRCECFEIFSQNLG